MHTAEPSALAFPLLTLCALLVFARPGNANAEVVHGTGYEATVAGWTSWYGSYQLTGVGQTWCIDHGLQAPDAAFGYRPIPPPAIPPTSLTAMAWVLGRYGSAPSAVDAAAIMLVLHDLNGAVYPQGPLHVDLLAPGQLAGFGGAETAVRSRAVQLKADGLAHAGLRGPFTLSLAAPSEIGVGQVATVTARIRDADGRGVAGIAVTSHALGASPRPAQGTTGADGSVTVRGSGDGRGRPPHCGRGRPEHEPPGVRTGRCPGSARREVGERVAARQRRRATPQWAVPHPQDR